MTKGVPFGMLPDGNLAGAVLIKLPKEKWQQLITNHHTNAAMIHVGLIENETAHDVIGQIVTQVQRAIDKAKLNKDAPAELVSLQITAPVRKLRKR